MKNIINKIFFRNANKIKQLNEKNNEDNSNTDFSYLIFTFRLPHISNCQVQYNIIQYKRKDNTVKCIAKLTDESKTFLEKNKIHINFIKQVIIFSFNKLNKFNFIYYNSELDFYSTSKQLQNAYYYMPVGCFMVTLDQPCDHQLMDWFVREQLNYKVGCYKKTFFNK